jgi:hypothetical protein
MKSVLIISFSDIVRDPRVSRQLSVLGKQYEITVAGIGTGSIDGATQIVLGAPPRKFPSKLLNAAILKLGMFETAYWRRATIRSVLEKFTGNRFDLILANDIDALPVALRLAGDAPVLLDAHEYSPREFEESVAWRLIMQPYRDYLCRTYLPRAAGMLTVCQGIADEYGKNYGVRPKVVMNAPMEQDLRPSKREGGGIRLIHHGAALRGRRIESMIELVGYLDQRFTLDFMLVPSDIRYFASLKRMCANEPRIHFREPVALPDICQEVNEYDMGVYILEPTNFNNAHALPNKFFEFVQARLGVAIGPSPEMAALVKQYNLGVVAESFEPRDLASRLNALSAAEIYRFKENAHQAATDLSFEHSGEVLLEEVRRLLGG